MLSAKWRPVFAETKMQMRRWLSGQCDHFAGELGQSSPDKAPFIVSWLSGFCPLGVFSAFIFFERIFSFSPFGRESFINKRLFIELNVMGFPCLWKPSRKKYNFLSPPLLSYTDHIRILCTVLVAPFLTHYLAHSVFLQCTCLSSLYMTPWSWSVRGWGRPGAAPTSTNPPTGSSPISALLSLRWAGHYPTLHGWKLSSTKRFDLKASLKNKEIHNNGLL